MSLLLRVKLSPLKKLYPSLIAPFSTSVPLSAKRKTSEEILRDLEAGEAIHAEIAKTNARGTFLSQFNGGKTEGLQKYAQLSDEEREEYRNRAAMENEKRQGRAESLSRKEQHQVKLYMQAQKNGSLGERKLKALTKGLPKKPSRPFGLFVKENYANHSSTTGDSALSIVSSLAKKWSSLPDSQKQRYSEKYEDLHEQYKVNFSKWINKLSNDERVLLASKGHKYLTRDQRSALSDASPYQAFLKKAFASMKGKNTGNAASQKKLFAETFKEALRKWEALSDRQRQAWPVDDELREPIS